MKSQSFLKWKIGGVEICQVVELREAGKLIQSTIQDATPENIKKIKWLYPHFADKSGNIKSLVQSFLIKAVGKNILVDTCNGNNKKRTDLPGWSDLKTGFLENLQQTGVDKDEIDFVVFTHLHCDHVGWNTYLKDGKWISTFMNAKHLFPKEEFDYWKTKPEKEFADDKTAYDDSVEPIIKAGLGQIVTVDYEIIGGVRLFSTVGHTPGHVSIKIDSKDKHAIISGDFIHHPCQFEHPEWTMNADSLPDKALSTRLKLLNQITDTDTLLIGSHFSNPVAGYVKRKDKNFIFEIS